MLDDIDELRAALDDFDNMNGAEQESERENDNATSMLLGAKQFLSFEQVLSQFLPPKEEVDRIVSAYFRSRTIAAPFFHTGHFRRSYQLFWNNPSATSPLWVSVLFSILNIITRTATALSSPVTEEVKVIPQFDMAAAHCLMIGEYYRPQKLAFEALLLHLHSICITSADLGPDVAILFGTLARLAIVMGYHKDPDGSRQSISVFEVEMRRRAWSLFMQLDVLISFQLGLPTNVQSSSWDTKAPTNLLDSEFDEDTIELPPSRPETDPTELLFYIAKHRLMAIFEKVIQHTLATTERPNGELEAIDREIRETVSNLPALFQPRSMEESIVDTPSIVVARLCVNSIYKKSLCVLHRKYVTHGRKESLQICQSSAADLVEHFFDIYLEFEPGGQLETERWFMNSMTWHDFLLGCMALCLTLCCTRHRLSDSVANNEISHAKTVQLLQNAQLVFEKNSAKGGDTKRVRQVVQATILKFTNQHDVTASMAQASFQTTLDASDMNWQAMLSTQGSSNDIWGLHMAHSEDDSGWAYMEQFLDLSE